MKRAYHFQERHFLRAGLALLAIALGSQSAFCVPASLDGAYVREWLIAGPISGEDAAENASLLKMSAGEIAVREGASFTDAGGASILWESYLSEEILVPLAASLPEKPGAQVLAYCEFTSAKDGEAYFFGTFSQDMPACVLINGLAYTFYEPVPEYRFDDCPIVAPVKAGLNRCLIAGKPKRHTGAFAFRGIMIDTPMNALPTPLHAMMRVANSGAIIYPLHLHVMAGDDPAWADPAYDDSAWPEWTPRARGRFPFLPPSLEAQVIWFRFHIQVAPEDMSVPICVDMFPRDTALDLYLDGRRVGAPQYIRGPWPEAPRSYILPKTDTVAAVRWDHERATRDTRGSGFELLLMPHKQASEAFAAGSAREKAFLVHRVVLICLFAVLLLLHGTIGLYYPRRYEYLWFGVTLASCLLTMICYHISESTTSTQIWHWYYYKAFLGGAVLSALCGLGLFQYILLRRVPWTFYVYVIMALGCYALIRRGDAGWAYLFQVMLAPEALRISWIAVRDKQPGVWVLLPFAILLIALICAHAMASLYAWPEENGIFRHASWYGVAIFALAITVVFARNFAKATRKLERFSEELEEQVQQRTHDLQEALENVKTLSGLLPICASCKRVRDDSGYWNQIEAYISSHSEARFTHGICPECTARLYPDVPGKKGH